MAERPTDEQLAEWREKWREAYDGTNGGKEAALVRLSRLCFRVLDELVAERKRADVAEAKLSAVRELADGLVLGCAGVPPEGSYLQGRYRAVFKFARELRAILDRQEKPTDV